MPRFTTIQQRFTQGELDPAMIGRDDIDQYFGALASARNIFPKAQGGFSRRPGLEHIDRILGGSLAKITAGGITVTAPNGGTASNATDQNPATTFTATATIGTANPYVVIQYDFGTAQSIGVAYINGLRITSGSSDEFFIQVSNDASSWVTKGDALELTTTAKDYTRRVHGSFRYLRLARIGTTDLSTADISLTGLDVATESGTSDTRAVDFQFNVDQTYKMIFSDKNIAIYQGDVYLIDIWTPDITEDLLPSIDWESNADTLLIFNGDFQTITLQRQGANDAWDPGVVTYANIPTFDFGSGVEPIWSSTRGWPRRGAFYQGRLYVDGGRSRPSVAYGSKVNDFFNYDFGTKLDDEAIGPLSDGFNSIEGFYPGRNLIVFTSNEEYVIPQTLGEAITPSTAVLSRQTSIGSEANFRPQEVEGGVMYIQRAGASIQEFIFDDGQQAFNNNFVSLLSSHLIDSPVDFALRKSTSTEDGAYLLLVLANGELTIANILRSQGIASFVPADTNGKFKRCGTDVSDIFFVVERTINGVTANYLERFNNDHFMDASTRVTTGLPTNIFNDLDHLEGEECRVLADGAVQDNETPSGGSVTLSRNAETSFEIGLNFTPLVIDLPSAVVLGSEVSMTGRKMNISEITLRLKDTADITVNGKRVSFKGFGPAGGGSPLDVTPTRFTGVKRLYGWRGWVEDAQVTITQTDPLPMTVLAIKKRVNT